MKKIINLSLLLSFFAFFLLLGCQKEEQEFIDETTEETITANSTLANLLVRTTQNDGGFDDLIDNNNCASVVLPVTVIANGQEVVINDEDDYDTVEDIFDQFPTDTDILEIIFPIQIVLANFETITVNSQEELNAIIAACDDNDPSNDSISCVDIVYPITFFIYDSEQQQIGTETVNSDVELFLFLLNLDENLFISIDFPITVIVDGTAIEVTSNEQLELLISQADCDDDDDINNEEFTEILTDGVWYVTEYFDDTDQTGLFTDYEFTFAADNTAQATDGSNNVPGTWNLSSSSSDLDLFFGTADPFDELDDDWDIIEYTTDIIRLKDVSGGNGGTDYLTFERTPGNGNNDDLNMFIENLTDGGWFVTVLEEDSDPNEACDYNGYEFNFSPNGTATAISTSNTVNGLWTANGSGGDIDLILNFENSGGDDPFEDLNDDWDVLQGTNLIIELTDVSGGNGGTDFLSFERTAPECGGGSGDVTAFVNQLTDGDWFVTLLEEDGDPDEACNYVDYEFTFSTDGTVMAVSSEDNVNGFWSAMNSSGGIDLSLDFDITVNPIFDDLNDEDWEVLEFDANIIRLRDVSGGGGGTDLLNFGRTAPAGCDPTGASDLEDILIDGIWIVASYDEDGDDQTSDYNGYSLDFMMGGAVTVSGPSNFSGSWAVIPSGGNLEMSLNFGTSIPFDEFNDDDWEVIDVQGNRVEIRDVSGGGGGIDTLVFEKL